jgi:hypothetical protein
VLIARAFYSLSHTDTTNALTQTQQIHNTHIQARECKARIELSLSSSLIYIYIYIYMYIYIYIYISARSQVRDCEARIEHLRRRLLAHTRAATSPAIVPGDGDGGGGGGTGSALGREGRGDGSSSGGGGGGDVPEAPSVLAAAAAGRCAQPWGRLDRSRPCRARTRCPVVERRARVMLWNAVMALAYGCRTPECNAHRVGVQHPLVHFLWASPRVA